MKHFCRPIGERIAAPASLDRERLRGLLLPFGRSAAIRRHAAEVILARVQLVGAIFALLVPLWSVVDLWVFDGLTAWSLVAMRLASAGVFALLAWPHPLSSRRPYAHALGMLVAMMMVAPLFYLASQRVIALEALDDWQRLVAQLYAFMPTLVLAGLAIFPLTALEILLLSLPVLAAGGYGMAGDGFSLQRDGAGLWFMSMMMGVAMFSGMSQLHYMSSLVRKVMTDPLTGALSRRAGAETAALMFRLAARSGQPFALAFFDLDRFKAINDAHGHEAGDRALRLFCERLRASLRRGDVVVRWGGEEFLVLLPDIDAERLPRLLRHIRGGGFGSRPEGGEMTASIGVAERIADRAPDWQSLVALADRRMYEAKRAGRDRALLPGERALEFGAA